MIELLLLAKFHPHIGRINIKYIVTSYLTVVIVMQSLSIRELPQMMVTFVIITRNRSDKLSHLITSILHTALPSSSLVLIDDSDFDQFERTQLLLRKYCRIPYEQMSSEQAQKEVESDLNQCETNSIKPSLCLIFGLHSAFENFISCHPVASKMVAHFLKNNFSPYAPARNLGIYLATKRYACENVVFLDDDCIITNPMNLVQALHLFKTQIDGREVVAVSGLYLDLLLSHRKTVHPYQRPSILEVLCGMCRFLKESLLTEQEQMLTLKPKHTLGGALILSKKALVNMPFDPFIPRGEDHAYAVDLRTLCNKDHVFVRDNRFIVNHEPYLESTNQSRNVNTLRDIFRFEYLRAKTGKAFIPYFTVRWSLRSLLNLVLHPKDATINLIEFYSITYASKIFAKENAQAFQRLKKAWRWFMSRIEN